MRPALLLLAGCVAPRGSLDVPIQTQASPADLVLDSGVEIRLDTAALTFADLRFETPAHARARPFSLVSTAHAHPGHGGVGDIAGELVGVWTVDLLGEGVALGAATFHEGDFATARLDLLPDPPVVLEGIATVDGQDRPFAFEVAADAPLTGLGFSTTLDAAAPPAGVALDIDLAHALSQVDWATPDEDGDGVLRTPEGALENSVRFGITSSATYRLTVEDAP